MIFKPTVNRPSGEALQFGYSADAEFVDTFVGGVAKYALQHFCGVGLGLG